MLPGRGKTAVTITLAAIYDAQRVLVVTTKSLVNNWKHEINLWSKTPERFLIISKETFKKMHEEIQHVDAVIFDEAHYFAGHTSQLHKTALQFLKKHNPPYIWLATATPMLSNVMSVWALSRIVGKPLGSFKSFQMRYFNMIKMGYRMVPVQKKNIERPIALDLQSIGVTLTDEQEADLKMPDQIHEVEYFTLTKEQHKAIEKLDEDPTTATPIVYLTKLLQIANGTLKDGETYSTIACDKRDRILELVEQNPRVAIVCRQTAELEMLHELIPNSEIYNGATPIEDRDRIIAEVNAGEKVMLLQADMGIGFNLTGISTMIFYSHTWDYIKYIQSVGRIHRLNQKNTCTYIHLITEGTPDQDVWECLARKESFDAALYNREK